MMTRAGLGLFLDSQGFVSDYDAGTAKADSEIYRSAAKKTGVAINRLLSVGENQIEVIGATVAAERDLPS